MPFFDLIIRWVELSDFGPKSTGLGYRIIESDFIRSDFAKSDCISRPILFLDRKIVIRSSESDRIINGLTIICRLLRSLSPSGFTPWLQSAERLHSTDHFLCGTKLPSLFRCLIVPCRLASSTIRSRTTVYSSKLKHRFPLCVVKNMLRSISQNECIGHSSCVSGVYTIRMMSLACFQAQVGARRRQNETSTRAAAAGRKERTTSRLETRRPWRGGVDASGRPSNGTT